jgi:hypothetical protein
MESCFADHELVRAGVHVRALADHERYHSFSAFQRETSGQTMSGFNMLRIEARGTEGRISVWLLRRRGPGVVLTVRPVGGADPGWGSAALRKMVPAVSRGSIKQTRRKHLAGAGTGVLEALAGLNRHRRRVMWAWTATVLTLIVAVLYSAARPVWHAGGAEAVAVAGVIPLLAGMAALLPPVRDAVLPAIEIAERTPGRRVAARAGLLAAPVAAVVTRRAFGG